tara:strand:+ start:1689 stop:3524 length:1836 start_codon:yes stop_codon:yes gene_type:complete
MPSIYPDYQSILKQKVKPTEGEKMMLDSLLDYLDDDYEIYWQPYLNGDQPDIILVKPEYGIVIIEVKDWLLTNYNIDPVSGEWSLKSNSNKIKSPVKQINRYKFNMVNLHIDTLLEKKIQKGSYLTIIKQFIFFSRHNEETLNKIVYKTLRGSKRFIQLLGENSLGERLLYYFAKAKMDKKNPLFTEDLYLSLKRHLQPPFHQIEDGLKINYTDSQKKLIVSSPGERRKISGVAGSGKTLVIAKRAVNAHLRTNDRVLILTYNLALINYINDRISDVRENFDWLNFNKINYHQFFLSSANNFDLPISSIEDFQNTNFFTSVSDKIRKYQTIIIDEVQDYEPEWLVIITKYFLHENGEFVVFGDEKQNVYNRELDENRKPKIPTIPGAWNRSLNESHRFQEKLAALAANFQKKFMSSKYEIDDIKVAKLNQADLFDTKRIEYHYFNDYGESKILDNVLRISRENNIHPSDICILSSKIQSLRKLDYHIRKTTGEKPRTSFETEEINKFLIEKFKEDQKYKEEIKAVRRNKKLNFFMKTGSMKLSTTHSFKGWESPALFVIIEKDDEQNDEKPLDELIYTAITRARFSLFIFNLELNKYHDFFKQNVDTYYES